ncbi:MAG: TIR domain-containing protein [Methanocalculaceae archaeon]|nr:TIR domain-containing protein [Methanocalculaceae archaeon]
MIDGNEPVSVAEWENIKRRGEQSIADWIDKNLDECTCLVVLVGSQTASRKWVK